MNDSARQEAYFSAKESGVTVAWPIGLSTTAAVDLNAAVPALGDLPTKLSALSDILEEAGATDDDVEEVRTALFLDLCSCVHSDYHSHLYGCSLMYQCCSRADVGLERSARSYTRDIATAEINCRQLQHCGYCRGGCAAHGLF